MHHLSFGQKKRVTIAGVLAMQPEVLLLDRPMAGLDAAMQVELQRPRLVGSPGTGHHHRAVHPRRRFAYRWADDIHLLAAGRCLASFAAGDLPQHTLAFGAPPASRCRRWSNSTGRWPGWAAACRRAAWMPCSLISPPGTPMILAVFPVPPCQVPPMAVANPGTVFCRRRPGDPDLITVKGTQAAGAGRAILFAGSLVDRAATLYAPANLRFATPRT